MKRLLNQLTEFPRNCLVLVLLLSGCAAVSTVSQQQAKELPAVTTSTLQDDYASALELLKSAQYLRAEQQLLAISVAAPDLSGPWANLGIVYAHTGRPEEARHAYLAALERNPRNAVVHNQLGVLFRNSGQFSKALHSYQQALAIDADYAYAHLNLGILYDLYLQQPAKALDHYQIYQKLVKGGDDTVSLWIIDLKRRLASRTGIADKGD